MSFHFRLRSVPPCGNPNDIRKYLEEQREMIINLVKCLNDLGCGLMFDEDDGRLAVAHDGISVLCHDGILASGGWAGHVNGNLAWQSGTMLAVGVI